MRLWSPPPLPDGPQRRRIARFLAANYPTRRLSPCWWTSHLHVVDLHLVTWTLPWPLRPYARGSWVLTDRGAQLVAEQAPLEDAAPLAQNVPP